MSTSTAAFIPDLLSLLGDVTIATAADGHALIFSGELWVNRAIAQADVTGLVAAVESLNAHLADTSNPHAVSAAQVGAYTTAQVDTALALKAPLASPAFTGTPTAPTAAASTNSTQVATTAFVRTEIAALVNSAPGTLDTLGEIATQLANDESVVTALTTTVAGKLAKASNLSDLTNAGTARANLGLGDAATYTVGSGAGQLPSIDFGTGTLALGIMPAEVLAAASASHAAVTIGTANGLSLTGGLNPQQINLAAAGAASAGAVTTGTQTIAGAKTFNAAATFGSSVTAASVTVTTDGYGISSVGGTNPSTSGGVAARHGSHSAYTFLFQGGTTSPGGSYLNITGQMGGVVTVGNQSLAFGTNSLFAILVDTSQRVLIGASSNIDSAKLQLTGTSCFKGQSVWRDGSNNSRAQCEPSNSRFVVASGGDYVWASTSTDAGGTKDTSLRRVSAGLVEVADSNTNTRDFRARDITATQTIVASSTIKPGTYTVATLPSAGTAGRVAFATNGRKSGEGSGAGTGVPVWDDGTAWRVYDGSTVAA